MINKELPKLSFEQYLVSEYFRLGSINKVFQEHKYYLPISFAGFDRVLSKFGVIKSAGPNSKISESLYLLSLLANYKIPLEKIYHRHAPRSVQVSTNTLHRILHYTRLGLTRRQGVALIISNSKDKNKILVGHDLSISNSSLGKKGDLSLPMGHSKVGENVKDSIARVLQNEVFTDMVVNKTFPWSLIPEHIKPIMFINIADIKVAVYHLEISSNQRQFSSYKLSNIKFVSSELILKEKNVRPGIKDILNNYAKINQCNLAGEVQVINSELNSSLYALAKQPAE